MLRTVLIVDDSPLVQRMLQVLLARYRGARVVTAADGSEALDLLGREPDVDLILLDINMPVMSGLELLVRLKRDPPYQAIPVIVVTTDGDEVSAHRCLEMGAEGFISKPVNASALYKLIEQATGHKPA
jgi:two-component system, chemotaxis family, chemotaxis protein CheY